MHPLLDRGDRSNGGAGHGQDLCQGLTRSLIVLEDEHPQTGDVGGRPRRPRGRRGLGARFDERNHHPEGRPVPLAGALRAHRAAVQVDEVLHDCEAETEAAVEPGGGAVRLAEAAEEVRDELARNPHPSIAHRDPRLRGRTVERHRHGPAPRGELDGIREQVRDDLLHPRGVRVHGGQSGRNRRLDRDGLHLR